MLLRHLGVLVLLVLAVGGCGELEVVGELVLVG